MAEGNDFIKDSSLELVLENIVHDEESDIIWNLHQELNFDHEGELREVTLQKVEISQDNDKTPAESIRSRLFMVRDMAAGCEIHIDAFLLRLREELQESFELQNLSQVLRLQEVLSQWHRLHVILTRIMSEIEILLERVVEHAASLTDELISFAKNSCDELEDNVHDLITYILAF